MEKDLAIYERVATVEAELGKQGVRLDNAEKRITKVETQTEEIHRIANAIELISHDTANMNSSFEAMKSDMKEQLADLKTGQEHIAARVNTIENEPAKKAISKLDSVKDKATWLIIGGILLYLLSMVFPQIFKP